MGQQGNQRGNQKTARKKSKWKHSYAKPDRINTVLKRIVFDDTSLPQKTVRVNNKNPSEPNLKPKGTRKKKNIQTPNLEEKNKD